jgi:exopolyphosphatase/guanosine-5'-triphosphate,3'-diphosphate pyrophosphatase
MPSAPSTHVVAGVDLGSNSFHMVVARVVEGHPHVIDRLREGVRLAAGLDKGRRLTREAQERALGCLARFGQRLRGMPQASVRAVGTNTLRQARGARDFIAKAQRALAHPIEIISGREEARLIYLGVAHDLSREAGRHLVVDIGGGSTECIIGRRFEPLEADSLYMGCVGYSLRFFPEGRIRPQDMQRAETAARLELQSIERRYRKVGWDDCSGSSGTIVAIAEILRQSGYASDGITAKGLKKLRKALITAGHVSRLSLRSLQTERAQVLPGGLAILAAVFASLGIKRMTPSLGALREGLLYDLIGRIRHADARDRTIRRLSERYHVDFKQAARVERTALALLSQVAAAWDLDQERAGRLLAWASSLHEIGLSVSYVGYHRHSAYLVENGDMPGFSREEQQALAALVRNQRRKLALEGLGDLSPGERREMQRLCVILRLAVCLNRSRSRAALPRFELRAKGNRLAIELPHEWLEHHPLTRADLADDAARLRPGFLLAVR